MALSYSQWMWGFEVLDQGSGQNNMLDFRRAPTSGTDYHATLNAGVYTPDELAAEIQRAMRAADGGNSYTCSFDFGTLKFTIAGSAAFDLRFGDGANHSIDCAQLAGFSEANKSSVSTVSSDAAVGTSPSTALLWTQSEPNSKNSPVTANAIGSPASNLQRRVKAVQNITDGMVVETIYFGTLKKVSVEFRALASGDQTSMESFLDWALAGKRFTWQPDKTSTNALKLVLAVPQEVNDDFEWLTRSEATYGTLTFYEQLS